MVSSCVYLMIPAATANQPPKFSVSSTNGRGMFSSGVSSAINASASPRFRGRRCRLLFNGKFQPITTRFRCNSQLVADIAPATAAAYGALLTSGGLFAYKRSGSKGSLIGGLTGGSLMAAVSVMTVFQIFFHICQLAYFLMQATDTKGIGEALAFGSTLLFALVFGMFSFGLFMLLKRYQIGSYSQNNSSRPFVRAFHLCIGCLYLSLFVR
ncbi:hypothetical protein RHMOL_Rhmol02G0318700 [Rhododendron molle]|uniref:Uncharacterized protein n=1 Tax=Rhododendron molle TaxID=49168 RepID=A0ACC0PW37_RHOML|nr:hypothetical protein RHMOL_Rhmol02G0318700 [Rhododendron molle]